MPNPSPESGPSVRPPHAMRSHGIAIAAALSLALPVAVGCGLFRDHKELRESRRVAHCRWDAKHGCRKLAKEDPSLDVEECVSERAWQCALDEPGTAEKPQGDTP